MRFVDGFSSPPHIHNVTYRGVVLHGFVHNDDPSAEPMWMPRGSFWTQPKGAVHVTSAKSGEASVAYIEIDEGPYLVRSTDDAFETDERPVNVHASNIVWVDSPDATSDAARSAPTPQIAYLWAERSSRGLLVKVPARTAAVIRGDDPALRVVSIDGDPVVHLNADAEGVLLEVGSLVTSNQSPVRVSCHGQSDCVLYLRVTGTLSVRPERYRSR